MGEPELSVRAGAPDDRRRARGVSAERGRAWPAPPALAACSGRLAASAVQNGCTWTLRELRAPGE
jgi:hypothetical protein